MRYAVLFFLFLLLKTFQAFPQNTASEQVKSFDIEAPQLDASKTIWVYIPKNYNSSKISYPVIYMHDAQNIFDDATSYTGEWKVDEFLDKLRTKNSIVVGIEHGNEKRIDELTPYTNEKYGGGLGDNYLNFIKNTLKPHIDSTYRTIKSAEHTTLFGASLGGLISFYGVIKYPDTFGKAGVFSPSFWINEQIYDFVKTTDISALKKFYFLVGAEEGQNMVSNVERMVTILKEKGIKENQIKNTIVKGGRHNEAFWGEYFGDAYLWLNR
ncbi:putative alpha/beta superfamily hydrolase [Winogradskyella wandonensis]|uniref:Putative alpha/beta superfamily hydrolase n=1 Tax=Winogradskyella wandonensis TaxID=1442586 RepID=A0A4R1KP25_9FLAO|nr:alpha/beta hydrolase-fold protein [Winogradskyella wandonensis]TCK66752.1 putative alpha/beta superfamily hydrolase [Winogradskyella wandonensis]